MSQKQQTNEFKSKYTEEQIKNSIVSEFIGNEPCLPVDAYQKVVEGTEFMLPIEELEASMERFAKQIQDAVNNQKK